MRDFRRRIRRAPESFGRKIFDFGIVGLLTLIVFYLSQKDWTQYRSIIQINIDKYGPIGYGHSQYIRGYALSRQKTKNIPGKVIINGPLNPNHKPMGNVVSNEQKFLLPLQQVGLKIHQVINSLRDSIILAEKLNRTLVLPPLLHVTSKKHTNDFEVNETTITAWDSWRTIDTARISQRINLIGLHQYREICGKMNGLQTIFSCQRMSNVKNNHFRFQEIFREVWGFEPLALMDLNGTIEMQYPTSIVSTQRKNEEKMDLTQIASMFGTGGRCATLVYPHSCYTSRATEWTKISPFFRLHPRVRSISDGFVRKTLKGKDFAVVRMDFQDICERMVLGEREKCSNPVQWDLCKIVLKLPTEFIANRLSELMKKKSLGFIYFTAPLGFEEDRVKEIVKMIQPKAGLMFDDLQNYIRNNKPALVNSTVDFSLAEVDLAFRANFFLGGERSEWSRMAAVDRMAEQKSGDISLVNFLVNDQESQVEIKDKSLETLL